MSFTAIIALLPSIFKFWDQIVSLIDLLQKTPIEQHEALMDKIKKESEAYSKPGSRPSWNA